MRWKRNHRDSELDEEIRTHIRMAIQDRIRQGEDLARARIEVMKEFGNVTLAMEDTRNVWGGQWLEQLAFDLRYAARSLARTPGFAGAAVLSLAIGIGATTALFSVLQHVAWQPLPYRNPDKLAIVWNLDPRWRTPSRPLRIRTGRTGGSQARGLPVWHVPQSSWISPGRRAIAAVGTPRSIGDFLPLLGRRACPGPLLER
jgi:hypothetical protein